MVQLLVNCYTHIQTGQHITDVLYNSYDSLKMFDNIAKVDLKPGESLRSRVSTHFNNYRL